MTDEKNQVPQMLEDGSVVTETIDLGGLFTKDVTSSGSFDISGHIRATAFGKLTEVLPIPALLIDQDHHVISANQACGRISAEYAKILGTHFSSLFPYASAAKQAQSLIEEIFATRRSRIRKGMLQIAQGRMWGRMTFRPVRIGGQRLALVLVEDLTLERNELLVQQELNKQLKEEVVRRQAAEKELAEREKQYREVVETAGDIIFRTDSQGFYTFVNQAALRVTGCSGEEIIGRHFRDLVAPEHKNAVERFYRTQWLKRLPSTYYEFPVVTKHGETVWLGQNTQLLIEAESIIGSQAVARDITERRRAEEALESEKKKFQLLAENAPFGMAIISKEGVFEYVNPKFTEIFGYELSDVPNGRAWFRKAYPDLAYRHEVISAWLEDSKNYPPGETRPRVFSVTCKDGSQKIIHHRPVQLNTGEELITCEDITDLKRSEEQLRASLKEKNAMLGEIHHRVKNNLAVVSSLLRSQSRYATDEPHRRMFNECETRVTSMALAHELLYRSENLSDIRVNEYVSKLLDYLVDAMKAESGSIDLKKEIEDVVLGLDKVIPLGLIVSELVSNSLQHAFPEQKKGQIRVSLRSIGELDLELVVRDNGVGMPENVDLQGGTSMGLDLVRILSAQLGGKIKIVTDKGTQVTIEFQVGNP